MPDTSGTKPAGANWSISLGTLLDNLPVSGSNARFFYGLRHGTMRVGLYAPLEVDDQSPHDQDELYFVISGSGTFRRGLELVPFDEGDVIFVPAGMAHSFRDFPPGFSALVIFWGPAGGE